jgi:hypothetical protein
MTNSGTTAEQAPAQSGKKYHIEGVLGITKTSLKKSIWRQSEASEEACKAISLLESRRDGMFLLAELFNLADWLTWDDAAASGEEDAQNGLTKWRDRRCKRRADRAFANLRRLQEKETQ